MTNFIKTFALTSILALAASSAMAQQTTAFGDWTMVEHTNLMTDRVSTTLGLKGTQHGGELLTSTSVPMITLACLQSDDGRTLAVSIDHSVFSPSPTDQTEVKVRYDRGEVRDLNLLEHPDESGFHWFGGVDQYIVNGTSSQSM